MNDNEFDDKRMTDQLEDSERTENYEVGYGKPPKHTRFKKGASGNPAGRRKKPLDFDAALLREARSLMTITDNGRKKRVSKHDVVVKQMVNNAMKGKASAQRMYFDVSKQVSDKTAQLEAQCAKDIERKSAKDYTEEELRQFLRDYQKSEEWMERKKLLSTIE